MSLLERLAGALAGLAELIPERVMVNAIPAYVLVGDEWELLGDREDIPPHKLALLEYGLREECESRFWSYRQTFDEGWESGCYGAAVGPDPDSGPYAYADSPALALATALLAALEAPAGAGA